MSMRLNFPVMLDSPRSSTTRAARRLRRCVGMAAIAATSIVAVASPASANTRASAGSYMNSTKNLNQDPGAPSSFWVKAGVGVWMNCWTVGPLAMGQYKWFQITVREGTGYGATGYVPAPSVSKQWTASPRC